MSITASEARRNLFPLIEQVNDDRTAAEYAALQETAYLLRSPENARRLLTAYHDAVAGRGLREVDVAELEALVEQA
jgi:antitoxin YefM